MYTMRRDRRNEKCNPARRASSSSRPPAFERGALRERSSVRAPAFAEEHAGLLLSHSPFVLGVELRRIDFSPAVQSLELVEAGLELVPRCLSFGRLIELVRRRRICELLDAGLLGRLLALSARLAREQRDAVDVSNSLASRI